MHSTGDIICIGGTVISDETLHLHFYFSTRVFEMGNY